MDEMLILHIASGLLGIYLVYMTFVMTKSSEGVWTNRLEEFWIRVDERRLTAAEKTKVLLGRLADIVTEAFDRVFGPRLISTRTIGISGSLSFASFLIIAGITMGLVSYLVLQHPTVVQPRLVHAIPILILLVVALLFFGGLCLILAVLPMFLKSKFWSILSCIPTALWLVGTVRLYRLHLQYDKQAGIAVALAASFASDVLILALIRETLRWIQTRTSVVRIVVALLVQVAAFCLIFLIPIGLPILWKPTLAKNNFGLNLALTGVFNIPTVIACAVFAATLIVVLVHRIFWPLLSQWTYVLTRNDVLEKRKTIRAFGLACMLYGISGQSGFLWELVQKALK